MGDTYCYSSIVTIETISFFSLKNCLKPSLKLSLRPSSITNCNEVTGIFGAFLTDEEFICYGSSPRVSGVGISVGDIGGPVLDASRTCLIGVSTIAAFSSEGNERISIVTRTDQLYDWIRDAVAEPIIISL